MADVRCLLAEASTISKHETAVLAPDAQLLFHELEERVLHVAANLRSRGCAKGTRIGLWMDNEWRSIIALLAIIRAGGVAVLLGARWPAAVAERSAARVGCLFVLTDAARRDEAGSGLFIDVSGFLTFASDIPDRNVRMPLDQPAVLVFTSGSSGEPRAAQLSYGNLYYSVLGSNRNIRLHSRDRWLLSLPLHHVGGLGVVFRCLQAGATLAIPLAGQGLAEAQETVRATHLSVVHTQLHRLVQQAELPASFEAVKALLLGGGPVDASLVAAALRRKLPVHASYGLTEMSSQVTTVAPATPPRWRTTSGQALAYRKVNLAADGEVLVRGEVLFQGYVTGKGPAAPAVDAEGWFHTGDLGRLDDQGYLSVDGRKDFMFVCGGENVHPEEIELQLQQLPGVERAAVAGAPDAEFGHVPVAFVKASGFTPDAWSSALSGLLPKHKLPRRWLPWPAEWEGAMGKIDRRDAAARARVSP